jgi:hypothetical protein
MNIFIKIKYYFIVMTSTTLIEEITKLSTEVQNQITANKKNLKDEVDIIDKTINILNTKISKQADTITELQRRVLDKTAQFEQTGAIEHKQEKEKLQRALSAAQVEQNKLLEQNSVLENEIKMLQEEYSKTNTENLMKLEQIKRSLRAITGMMQGNYKDIKTKLSDINSKLQTLSDGPVLRLPGGIVPLEITEDVEVKDDEEVELEDDEEVKLENDEEVEVKDDEEVEVEDEEEVEIEDEEEVEIEDEEEVEVEDEEEVEIEDEEEVEIEDDEEVEIEGDEELQFGKSDFRIIDSSDDEY